MHAANSRTLAGLVFSAYMRYNFRVSFGMGAIHLKRKQSRKKRKKSIIRLLTITLVIGLLLAMGALYFAPDLMEQGYAWLYPLNYKEYILEYSEVYKVDPYMMFALFRTESAFDPKAVSPVGAMGLGQIMPDTGQWLAEKMSLEVYSEDMLYIPATSIEMSCYYMNMLIGMFESTDTALAAYNAGMGTVSTWLQDGQYSEDGVTLVHIPYQETRDYVERINEARAVYIKLYPNLVPKGG